VIEGNCLCGDISFSISGDPSEIYQCHCSVCRKVTGSTGISVFIAFGDNFKWIKGENLINIFVTPSGYRSVFCSKCGSHVPDSNPDKSIYWVQAGLINGELNSKVGSHIFVGSKAHWDLIGDEGVQHVEHFPN